MYLDLDLWAMILIFERLILIFKAMILIFHWVILIFDLDQKISDLLQLWMSNAHQLSPTLSGNGKDLP